MLWVEIEVNSSDPKHMVDPTWCVDEVGNASTAGFHDIWWFWCHLQTSSSGIGRRLVHKTHQNLPVWHPFTSLEPTPASWGCVAKPGAGWLLFWCWGRKFLRYLHPPGIDSGHRGVQWHCVAALLMRFDAGARLSWVQEPI